MNGNEDTNNSVNAIEPIKINFKHIIGNDEVKVEIENYLNSFIINYDKYQEYLKLIGADGAKGLMLYGLPGVGKSMFLKAIYATCVNHPDIAIEMCSRSSLMGTVGKNADKIAKVFNKARQTDKKLSVLLIDEADGLMATRGDHLNTDERTGEFITQLQGTQDSSKLLVIATTNDVAHIDEAVIDRFDIIEIIPPTDNERIEFIIKYIACLNITEPITRDNAIGYVNNSYGMTGRNYMIVSKRLKSLEFKNKILLPSDIYNEFNKFTARASIIKKLYKG